MSCSSFCPTSLQCEVSNWSGTVKEKRIVLKCKNMTETRCWGLQRWDWWRLKRHFQTWKSEKRCMSLLCSLQLFWIILFSLQFRERAKDFCIVGVRPVVIPCIGKDIVLVGKQCPTMSIIRRTWSTQPSLAASFISLVHCVSTVGLLLGDSWQSSSLIKNIDKVFLTCAPLRVRLSTINIKINSSDFFSLPFATSLFVTECEFPTGKKQMFELALLNLQSGAVKPLQRKRTEQQDDVIKQCSKLWKYGIRVFFHVQYEECFSESVIFVCYCLFPKHFS